MNDNIDLTKILKDCPKGTKLYSPILGDCKFEEVCIDCVKVRVGHFVFSINQNATFPLGTINSEEPMLFPSREQRSWSKFTAPWYKKDKFDPHTLQPFDKIIVCDDLDDIWRASIFSHIYDNKSIVTISSIWLYGIPYNDETKHLVGTCNEAPKYYRYWED